MYHSFSGKKNINLSSVARSHKGFYCPKGTRKSASGTARSWKNMGSNICGAFFQARHLWISFYGNIDLSLNDRDHNDRDHKEKWYKHFSSSGLSTKEKLEIIGAVCETHN